MTTEAPTQAQLAQQMSELLMRFQTFTKQQKEWLAGTPTGGPEGNGTYPLTDYLGTTYLVPSPALDSARVNGQVDSARDYAAQASSSLAASQTFLTQSSLARDVANDFAQAAMAARDLSQMYADQAGSHAANARAYAQDAAASAELAKIDLQALADSVSESAESARSAASSAASAGGSAADAKGSATAAAISAAQANTFNPANFAPIAGVNGDFTVRGALAAAGGTATVRAAAGGGNSTLWFADSAGKGRAVTLWDGAGDLLTLRKYDSGGNFKDVSIDNTGSLSVAGSGSFGSQIYSSHLYPLVEFRQPGTPVTQGEGFVGSWGGSTLLRSWPSGANHANYLELGVNCSNGSLTLSDATPGAQPFFKATRDGGVGVTGVSSSYNMAARDNAGQTWSTYASGNQYRVWSSYNGDVFKVGISGDAYILGPNSGGSLQIGQGTGKLSIGDDTSLLDVGVAHTLGLRSATNGSVGFLQFGTGYSLGWNGENLTWQGLRFGPSVFMGTTDANAVAGGHYMGNFPGGATQNTPTGGWTTMINALNDNGTWGFQISHGWFEDDLWYRRKYDSRYDQPWRKLWHSGNLVVSSGDPGAADGRIWIQI